LNLIDKIKMDQNMEGGKGCKCMHHKVVTWGIILFGLVFLLEALGYMSMQTTNIVWPIIVIVVGFTKMCKCDSRPMMK
jgi:hypothetical protein